MTIIACEARIYGLNFNFVCRIKIRGGGITTPISVVVFVG